MAQDLDTGLLPPDVQLLTYQDCINNQFFTPFRISLLGEDRSKGFQAKIASVSAGSVTAGRVRMEHSGYAAVRSADDNAPDIICFNFFPSGEADIAQDGRFGQLRSPGDFTIFSSTRDLRWRFTSSFHEYVLTIPRKELLPVCPQIDHLTACVFHATPSAVLLMNILGACIDQRQTPLSQAVEAAMGASLKSLAAAILNESAAGLVRMTASQSKTALLLRAKDCILKALGNPNLSPELIAARLGISKRSLYDLFEAEGTPLMAWLWEARLNHAFEDLCRESPVLSIGEIAWQNGFKSQAHFSKRFREKYGCSPKEAREKAALGRLASSAH